MKTIGYTKLFLTGTLTGMTVECSMRVDGTLADAIAGKLYGKHRDVLTGNEYRTDCVWIVEPHIELTQDEIYQMYLARRTEAETWQ